MENIDEQLKISIRSVLNSVSEETVTGIIQAVKCVGLQSLSDLKLVQEEDLILVLKPIQRRKLIKAWSEQCIKNDEKDHIIKKERVNSLVTAPHISALNSTATTKLINSITSPAKKSKKTKKSKAKKSEAKKLEAKKLEVKKSEAKKSKTILARSCKPISLLELYSKYKAELSCPDIDQQSIWKKISEEHRAQTLSDWDELTCCNKINEFRLEYERCKNNTSKKWIQAMLIFKVTKEVFETTDDQDEKEQVIKREKVGSLPKVIVSSTPPVSTFSTTTTVPVARSINTATTSLSGNCNGGKRQKEFENSVASFKISSKYYILLQMYAIHKVGFSCPGVEKQSVWKKIAYDTRGKCLLKLDEWQCCDTIEELRCKYESSKNDSVTSREMAKFLDEAKNAFETTENAVSLPANRHLRKCTKRTRIKDYHLKLLKVFIKYKADITYSNIEEQQVWEKIAQEMRDTYSYNCGQYVCRFDLFQLKNEYESLKMKDVKNKDALYFFEDAQKAFETAPNLGISDLEVEVKKTSKYMPPHLRNGENKQCDYMSSKANDISDLEDEVKNLSKYLPPYLRNRENKQERAFVFKVRNISKRAEESDLEELFKPFGTIHRIYMHKDEAGRCHRGFAFIRFDSQDDAVRAFFTVEGHKYDDLTLTVEWADLSQIAKDFE